MTAYQTFLPDCDCKNKGILFKDNIPCCRWCLKPWGHGGMINYTDESFKPEIIEPSKEKQWKVIELRANFFGSENVAFTLGYHGLYETGLNGEIFKRSYKELIEHGAKIHSVYRLKDWTVFSIGDEVEYRMADAKDWSEIVGYGKITEFNMAINDTKIIVGIDDENRWNASYHPQKYLENIRHKLPPSNKQELKEDFKWDENLVYELMSWYRNNSEASLSDSIIKFKQSKQTQVYHSEPISRNTWEHTDIKQNPSSPSTKERMPLLLSKDVSDFIQCSFNLAAEGWYWSEFVFEKVGANTYTLWDANDLPERLKNLIKPKIYTQQQMDKAITDAFNAGRERDLDNPLLTTYPGKHSPVQQLTLYADKYPTIQDYLNSLKTNPLKQ